MTKQSANSRWIAFTLWALWAFSAACPASVAPPLSASQLLTPPPLWDQGVAIADLDGDGRPDLAIVRAESWRSNAFQYRIELALTTRVGPTSFTVSARDGGLLIVPHDVDGDGYLDLVITSAWSLAPVGVYINDGHGGFTQGDPTAYPRPVWTEGPGVSSATPQETLKATVPESCRSWLVFPHGSNFCNELLFERLPLLIAAFDPRWVAVSQPQTRAPPRFLTRQPS